MQRHHAPRLLEQLYVAATQLSGLLAVIAHELGRPTTARAYAVEAFRLAEETRDPTARAWVRANQSLIEYYDGDYHQAGELARDGLRLDPGGPQSIRLLVNGVGRAQARLGHETEARRAIDQAQELLTMQSVPAAASHGLSLDPYCTARVSGNATTSFHLLHRTDEALTHGRAALTVFDSERLRVPQILTRFDLAMVLLNSHQPDPEQAAHLVSEAAGIAVGAQFESVTQRANEFLASASRWRRSAAIADVTDRVRALTAGGGVHD
jgi:tetratricopeptide (TPR) repeat protein